MKAQVRRAQGYNSTVNAERFRTNVFVVTLLLALGLTLRLVWPFWPAVAWAVVLAILIYPTHRRIARRIRNTGVAAGVSTLLTVALIVVPLVLILLAIIAEGNGLRLRAQEALGDAGGWRQQIQRIETGVIATVSRLSRGQVDLSHVALVDLAQRQLTRIGQLLPAQASDFAAKLARNFVQVGLSLVTLFFLLKDGSRLLPAVKAFIPLSDEQTDTVLSKAVETMYATFYGVVLVAMLQGTLGGLAFWALGLPSPLLWGVVMTMLCIIPLAGAPIIWLPAAALLAIQGEWGKAIILVLWGWLVVGTVDNITRPFIIGGRTSLHPLAVFFAILGGLFAVGGVGIFLGPVLLSVTLALLDILRLKLVPTPPGPPSAPPPDGGAPPAAEPQAPALRAAAGIKAPSSGVAAPTPQPRSAA